MIGRIYLFSISFISLFIEKIISKTSAKAIVSLPKTNLETLFDMYEDQYKG